MTDYALEIIRNQDLDKLRKLDPIFRKKVFEKCMKWLEESRKNPKILQEKEITRNQMKTILNEGSCVKRSLISLKDYQNKAVEIINRKENTKGILLYFDTGTGKTLTALTISQCYLDKNPLHDVLVITPTKLKDAMQREFEKYGGGTLPENYKFYTFASLHMADKVGQIKPADFNNPLLIVDEVHNVRNARGKMFETVMKYAMVATRRVLLTATPIVNRPADLVAIVNILEGKYKLGIGKPPRRIDLENGAEIYNHNLRYHIPLQKPKKQTHEEFSDKQFGLVISMFLKDITLRVTKNVNDKDYPKYTIHEKTFEMPEEYLDTCRRFLATEDADINLPYKELFYRDDIKLQTFYNGHRRLVNKIGKAYYSLKMDFIREIIAEKQKTLIYTNWDDFGVQVLMDDLTKIVSPSAFAIVSGSTSKKDAKENVERYNANKIKILIITKAGSEGLDLKGTRNVIVVDPVWNPSGMEQIIGRAVRYKSHEHLPESQRQVDIYQLLMIEPGIDIYDEESESISGDVLLYRIIRSKETIIQSFNEMLDYYQTDDATFLQSLRRTVDT